MNHAGHMLISCHTLVDNHQIVKSSQKTYTKTDKQPAYLKTKHDLHMKHCEKTATGLVYKMWDFINEILCKHLSKTLHPANGEANTKLRDDMRYLRCIIAFKQE